MNLGIDFASGTKLTVSSSEPITIGEVSAEMEKIGYSDLDFKYQTAS
ncbi:hypothetical protein, partial [Acinetobacter pittii]